MSGLEDTPADDRRNLNETEGATVGELLQRHPELLATWLLLALIDLEQQTVAVMRFTSRRRGVQLAPTLIGLAGGAAAVGLNELLTRLTSTGALPYRASLTVATATLIAAPLAGLGRWGVILPRRNSLWGLAVPVFTQLGWVGAFVILGRRHQSAVTKA